MIELTASGEDLFRLREIEKTYPIGISCNQDGDVWGCTHKRRHYLSERGHLDAFPLLTTLIAAVLRVYPQGGRLKLRGAIVYKWDEDLARIIPIARIAECALPRPA